MKPLTIACVVEGEGDERALPVLIRRIMEERHPTVPFRIEKPWRIPRSKIPRPEELSRALTTSAARIKESGTMLVVFDADMTTQYRETLHQERLAAVMDLEQAAGCRSFRKLLDEFDRLTGPFRAVDDAG